MGVFFYLSTDNQSNCIKSTSDAEWKKQADWSEQQEQKKSTQGLDSTIKISNNTVLQTIKVVRIWGKQLNKKRSDSEYLTMILSLRGVNMNSL